VARYLQPVRVLEWNFELSAYKITQTAPIGRYLKVKVTRVLMWVVDSLGGFCRWNSGPNLQMKKNQAHELIMRPGENRLHRVSYGFLRSLMQYAVGFLASVPVARRLSSVVYPHKIENHLDGPQFRRNCSIQVSIIICAKVKSGPPSRANCKSLEPVKTCLLNVSGLRVLGDVETLSRLAVSTRCPGWVVRCRPPHLMPSTEIRPEIVRRGEESVSWSLIQNLCKETKENVRYKCFVPSLRGAGDLVILRRDPTSRFRPVCRVFHRIFRQRQTVNGDHSRELTELHERRSLFVLLKVVVWAKRR
jgi:hypothetical protein